MAGTPSLEAWARMSSHMASYPSHTIEQSANQEDWWWTCLTCAEAEMFHNDKPKSNLFARSIISLTVYGFMLGVLALLIYGLVMMFAWIFS